MWQIGDYEIGIEFLVKLGNFDFGESLYLALLNIPNGLVEENLPAFFPFLAVEVDVLLEVVSGHC